jgi:hypothetical protein
MKAGMRKSMSPFAVVREEQQSEGVEIEPTYQIDSLLYAREKVSHNRSAGRIFQRRDISGRLVEHEVNPLRRAGDLPAIHLDYVRSPDSLSARFTDRLAIDGNPAGFDELIRFSSGSDAGQGQDLVNSLCRSRFPAERFLLPG